MELQTFNQLPVDDAERLVSVWADVGWWTAQLVQGRPYPDVGSVRETADRLAAQWSADDVHAALAAHPRIGEQPVGTDAGAAASRREQAAAATSDEATAVALRDGNLAYEHRFGRVFLIRAAGRSAPEILGELSRRLELDADHEAVEAAGQLREIALLRLEAELGAGVTR